MTRGTVGWAGRREAQRWIRHACLTQGDPGWYWLSGPFKLPQGCWPALYPSRVLA